MAPLRQEPTGDLLSRQVLKGELRVYSRPERTLVRRSPCLGFLMLSFLGLFAAASLHVPPYKRRAGGGGATNEKGRVFALVRRASAGTCPVALRFPLSPLTWRGIVVVL